MLNRRVITFIGWLVVVSSCSAQEPVTYWGYTKSPFVHKNEVRIIPLEPLPTGPGVGTGEFRIYYDDGGSAVFPCTVDVVKHDIPGTVFYGKTTIFWRANAPDLKPAHGFCIIKDSKIILSEQNIIEGDVPEISISESIKNGVTRIQWHLVNGNSNHEKYSKLFWVRFSFDAGQTWSKLPVPQGFAGGPGEHFSQSDEWVDFSTEQLTICPHPLIEFWITPGIKLVKKWYFVGKGGQVTDPPAQAATNSPN